MEDSLQNDNKETKLYLELEIKIWDNNSNGIFNFQVGQYSYVHDEIDQSYFYVRINNNDLLKIESQILFDNNNGDILFRIRKSLKNDNKYTIIIPIVKKMKRNEYNINHLNNAAWYVIRSEQPQNELYENENYILNENDILKFGRKKYEIIKININSSENEIYKNNNLAYNISQINKGKGSIFNINIEAYQYRVTDNDDNNAYIKEELENENMKRQNCNIFIKNDTGQIKEKKNNDKKDSDIKTNNDNNKNFIINNYENQSDYYYLKNESSCKINRNINNKNNEKNKSKREDENERCRICFISQSAKENPLLRICSCKDYIHFNCLKKYINTKIEISDNLAQTIKTYICPKFNCDVCLTPYPLRFRIKEYNKIYELIDYNIAKELDYIVLESLDCIENGRNYKVIHVIKLINDIINIGRNCLNDIIDTDTSVYERHAVLKYNKEKGYITIENRSENYGTLVLIRGNITIEEKKIGLQVGSNYVTACMIEKKIGENVFFVKKNKNDKTTQCSTIKNNQNENIHV